MKRILTTIAVAWFAFSASAVNKADLDVRLQKLTAKLDAMQLKPDKCIPPERLKKAQGIILLDRTKAGFVFAYQGGGGVALVRDPKSQKWSPVAFMNASEASLGFQIGGQQSFVAILLMTTNATRLLTEDNFEFGGEARGTAGDASAGVDATVSSDEQPVMIYDDRKGLYGGAAIKGGTILPEHEANLAYYGKVLTMEGILFDKKVKLSEPASALVEKLEKYSRKK